VKKEARLETVSGSPDSEKKRKRSRRFGPEGGVPEGCGLGLRREHYEIVLRERPSVPWFEVISENFMGEGGRPLHVLESVREHYPVALHGVSLSPGSVDAPRSDHLARLRRLVERIEPAIVSDHLCWTGLGGHNSHDLLPLPFTEEAVRVAAANIRRVQDALGRRILVENISTYLQFESSTLREWEFLAAVADEADCGILLDVNNVYVNARNHRLDPEAFLAGIPVERVAQFHLAGHEDHGDYVIDTHDHPVRDEVWALYERAVERFGPQPTLIERDAHVPELPVLLGEARRAQQVLEERHAVAAVR
jgi:uncharacterized protein (UPF0276 family)